MFRVDFHRKIQQILTFFYRVGFWNRQDNETASEWMLKLFYSVYFSLYPMSLLAGGAAVNDNKNDQIVSVQVTIMFTVLLVKLLHIIWRKRETMELLNEICDYSAEDRHSFIAVNNKSNTLMKFATVFLGAAMLGSNATALIAPLLVGSERNFLFPIWFPLDWRKDEFAFWMAYFYVFTELCISATTLLFSVIMWYMMAHCAWRYDLLGQQMKKMGDTKAYEQADRPPISDSEKNTIYCRDFCIAFIREDSSSDTYFKISIYSIGLLFNIFEIFTITFFGNEIKLASGRLAYCLFESNWVDRPQSVQKDILIFGECLQQPHQLMALKIYPLTLETFSRILHSAYSMFNILKNFK